MNDPIRVLLVDDQELIRLGFRLSLEADADIAVVGEASDGQEGLDLARELKPDVVIMDVRMPRLDGIAATARIVDELPSARVLVVTTFDLDEYAFGALEAGASGFLLKDATSAQLVAAVRSVHRGDAILSPRATRLLIEAHAMRAPQPRMVEPTNLTPRERDVLLAVGRGLNNTEIAAELFLSESTVKTHVGRLLTKLDARDRVHLVILTHRSGLVH
ncbi:response regulator transcription factor [Microbacterium horticulturae]|uniref:Response regulator transcription factor n=1 Tax=Microbacterium horticulturae TaxID=3028316 RepID=A0ABY8C1Z6_9MICO|nr:response regulator transcription factor [Microbacterium sp. KACC 23027]WEG10295.1 response regulator transcription factor [Microbacterium sp. KACC 23027]